MSNSKVFIFLSVYISPIFHRTGETSLSQSQSQSVSHSTSESDSLRGKFSTLRYFGSSRSELIGRIDAKIVLTAPLTLYCPHFPLPHALLSREWLSEWFTSTEAWFYAAKWVVVVVFPRLLLSGRRRRGGGPRLACSWQCLCSGNSASSVFNELHAN